MEKTKKTTGEKPIKVTYECTGNSYLQDVLNKFQAKNPDFLLMPQDRIWYTNNDSYKSRQAGGCLYRELTFDEKDRLTEIKIVVAPVRDAQFGSNPLSFKPWC